MALDRYDVPDFVREAEEAMARGETLPAPPSEVTIKFGKGLMGEPFTSKSGKELVEVKIPNVDPNDHRPWESFVVPASFIHDNQYGKGVWMKLLEDGTTVFPEVCSKDRTLMANASGERKQEKSATPN